MNRIQPGTSTSIAMATARLLLYGIIVPLTVVVWATVWVLSRPGVRGGLVCLNSAARFDKWNRAAVR